MLEQIKFYIEKIRKSKPLILNLTNYVTMDFVANALLAIGAAPIMSEETNELSELISCAHSININVGTLNSSFLERTECALAAAKTLKKIIVLDPVGCGATKIRTKASQKFIQYANVVRGNASEIISLDNNNQGKTLGVESQDATLEAEKNAVSLAERYNVTVITSGAADIVVKKGSIKYLPFGSPIMQYITGMGCVLSAVTAAFCSVETDLFQASLLSTAFYGLCGEQAEQKASCPGSFKVAFLDALYSPNFEFMRKRL
ncbi:hydroxyethylthiazole kinase [Wolbachia endosymbiont of Ctenocephalides felis wCfeT]|uniref:hydroxyethylthiazole kinase n=1 Tax=Wolbachia endosymbiont of Ctenocephalides felis wCfeT TaxID=2732593 RepID=UPI001445DE2F|nr:hydroxyethylthiazole kinase [Wolbachia endosymbiont of Ctenocephalides felis wCfeT]